MEQEKYGAEEEAVGEQATRDDDVQGMSEQSEAACAPRRKRTALGASSGAAETMSPVSSTVQDPARYAPCASPA